MSRILLVRHGETDGESSVRFHGSTDVPLSDLGRSQMRRAARGLPDQGIQRVVASPLSRAWEAARILAPSGTIHLESDFREIDFGRWEGLTKEEIEARDPAFYRAWQARDAGFEFPGGERRADFRARVLRGLSRVLAADARLQLIVAHKGVIRTIAEELSGEAMPEGEPGLGECVQLSRAADDRWRVGRRSSDPRVR